MLYYSNTFDHLDFMEFSWFCKCFLVILAFILNNFGYLYFQRKSCRLFDTLDVIVITMVFLRHRQTELAKPLVLVIAFCYLMA